MISIQAAQTVFNILKDVELPQGISRAVINWYVTEWDEHDPLPECEQDFEEIKKMKNWHAINMVRSCGSRRALAKYIKRHQIPISVLNELVTEEEGMLKDIDGTTYYIWRNPLDYFNIMQLTPFQCADVLDFCEYYVEDQKIEQAEQAPQLYIAAGVGGRIFENLRKAVGTFKAKVCAI